MKGFFKTFAATIAISAALFLSGTTLYAAQTKETPLSNLAKGRTPTLENGKSLDNAVVLTDGQKYNLDNGMADIGNSAYVQIDLGSEYAVEVINLKREEKQTFQNTAIVLASDEKFSDAQVIYYQNEADIKRNLPNAQISATAQGSTYAETYGGAWFYMEGDGMTPTAPQTVKKARYVRVYSDAPSGKNENKFMELAVYGYKDEGKMPEAVRKKRKIDAKHPLFIVPCYSSNYYQPGQDKEPEFKGEETISGRWAAVPEDMRPYHVLLAHTDNLGMTPAQQFPDTDKEKRKNQELLQSFYEHCLRIGYEQDIPVMLLGITASAVPNGGTRYNVTAMMDYGWLDLMYRMYPNLEGTFNSENHWSHCEQAVGTGSAEQLNIAGRHNGYFAWTERSDFLENDGVKKNEKWKKAVEEHGDALYLMYKSTGAVGGQEYSTQSYMQGLWLAGYTAGWGGLIDTWAWSNVKQGPLGKEGGGGSWANVVAYPEAMVGEELMSMYLEGATVYTLEHPTYTYGVKNQNSPLYTNVVEQVMKHIVEHPAPTRIDVLGRTKALLYGSLGNKDIFSGLVGEKGLNYFLYDTGRYGSLPVMADWKLKEELAAELARTCAENGISMPALLDVSDPNLASGESRTLYFKSKYDKEYNGNAFADLWNEEWYVYNNEHDPENIDAGQTAVLPLVVGDNGTARLKTTDLKAHTWFIADRTIENGSMEIYLNNYRTDKAGLFNRKEEGVTFDKNGDLAMSKDQRSCLGLEQYVEQQIKNPKDDTLRTTTWELTKLNAEPTVTVLAAQEWKNGTSPQVKVESVKFDPQTGKATITVKSNGWVHLKLSNLDFATDENAEQITEEPPSGNLVDNEKPLKPVDLVAEPSYTSVKLSFAPSTDNTGVKDYTMIVSPDHGEGVKNFNQTTLEVTGLMPDTDYTVRLKANDNFGNSSDPVEVSFRTLKEITISSSLVSGWYETAQAVSLTASDAAAEIYYTTDGSRPFDESGNPSASAALYAEPIMVDHGIVLTAGAKKDGHVHRISGWFYLIGGNSRQLDVPIAPNSIKAEEISGNQAVISWLGADPSASVFKVYVNGEEKYSGTELQTTITGLTPLTAYQIYVTAVDGEGNESLRSETIEIVTLE